MGRFTPTSASWIARAEISGLCGVLPAPPSWYKLQAPATRVSDVSLGAIGTQPQTESRSARHAVFCLFGTAFCFIGSLAEALVTRNDRDRVRSRNTDSGSR